MEASNYSYSRVYIVVTCQLPLQRFCNLLLAYVHHGSNLTTIPSRCHEWFLPTPNYSDIVEQIEHIPVDDQRSLYCPVGPDVTVSWTKDGEPYDYVRQHTALLEQASSRLNGTVFRCFTSTGGDPVLRVKWTIIVEGQLANLDVGL